MTRVAMCWAITLMVGLASHAGAVQTKKVYFIGTGGTIAGQTIKPDDPRYDAGKVTLDAILEAVPEIKGWAEIAGEQLQNAKGEFVNVPSNFLTESDWLALAAKANWALRDGGYDAVIVTHGTDTMEETSFFIHLTNKTQKPILFVGAYRPANHRQADGPENIRAAVKVAISEGSRGIGAAVVMDGKVYSAVDVAKVNKFDQEAGLEEGFASLYYAPLAQVASGLDLTVRWNRDNPIYTRGEVLERKFDVEPLNELPFIPILPSHIGNDSDQSLEKYLADGRQIIVLEGNGGGGLGRTLIDIIKREQEQKTSTVFVRTSRTPRYVDRPEAFHVIPNSVGGGGFRSAKAKILLQLIAAEARARGLSGSAQKTYIENEYKKFGFYMR